MSVKDAAALRGQPSSALGNSTLGEPLAVKSGQDVRGDLRCVAHCLKTNVSERPATVPLHRINGPQTIEQLWTYVGRSLPGLAYVANDVRDFGVHVVSLHPVGAL